MDVTEIRLEFRYRKMGFVLRYRVSILYVCTPSIYFCAEIGVDRESEVKVSYKWRFSRTRIYRGSWNPCKYQIGVYVQFLAFMRITHCII